MSEGNECLSTIVIIIIIIIITLTHLLHLILLSESSLCGSIDKLLCFEVKDVVKDNVGLTQLVY